jgi:hypothetical protein
VIAGTQLREFTRSRTANEKHDAGALALSFVYAERNCRAFSTRRYRHYELSRACHTHQFRSVKTKEDHAGRQFGAIENANIMNGSLRLQSFNELATGGGHAVAILGTTETYLLQKFSRNCD